MRCSVQPEKEPKKRISSVSTATHTDWFPWVHFCAFCRVRFGSCCCFACGRLGVGEHLGVEGRCEEGRLQADGAREDLHTSLRDEQRVLKLRRQLAVDGHPSPVIRPAVVRVRSFFTQQRTGALSGSGPGPGPRGWAGVGVGDGAAAEGMGLECAPSLIMGSMVKTCPAFITPTALFSASFERSSKAGQSPWPCCLGAQTDKAFTYFRSAECLARCGRAWKWRKPTRPDQPRMHRPALCPRPSPAPPRALPSALGPHAPSTHV